MLAATAATVANEPLCRVNGIDRYFVALPSWLGSDESRFVSPTTLEGAVAHSGEACPL